MPLKFFPSSGGAAAIAGNRSKEALLAKQKSNMSVVYQCRPACKLPKVPCTSGHQHTLCLLSQCLPSLIGCCAFRADCLFIESSNDVTVAQWLQVHLRHLVGGRARSFTGSLPFERIFQVRTSPAIRYLRDTAHWATSQSSHCKL